MGRNCGAGDLVALATPSAVIVKDIHMDNSAMLIHQFLEESAHRHPEKTAVVGDGVRATYAQVNASADMLARRLAEHGVQKGDRVVLIHENSFEYIAAYFAVLKAGAVVVPLSTELKPEGLFPIISELEARAVIASARQAAKVGTCESVARFVTAPCAAAQRGGMDIVALRDCAQGPESTSGPSAALAKTDLAAIIYTSGSTGKPKGVMLTHENIAANTRSICEYLELSGNDVQMVVLPFYYVMGMSLLNTHVAVGGTVVLNNHFAFSAGVLQQMIEEKVTGFSGVPSTYAYLLHRSPLAALRGELTALRYCSQAGGHMARQVKLDLRGVLPEHTKIVIMYGATEASARLTWLDPGRYHDKIDSIGKAIPGVVIRILDDKGNDLGSGKVGEIVASGPNIMQGYWKDAAATGKVLDQNGYHTGDMGYKDEEGFLFVCGRRDNQLKVGGHRVDPQEIEDALMESRLIIETAVVGVPDAILGTALEALAVVKSGATSEEELLAYCARRLPAYKMPRHIFAVDSLPKNSSGKIDRMKCAAVVAQLFAPPPEEAAPSHLNEL